MTRNLSVFLATRELRSDWQASLCFVAALVGVLAPLLIILALKNGMIGTMVGRLVEDPSNREILAVGAGSHDADFFARMQARPDVEFVIPATRSINTSADAVRNRAERKVVRSVPLIPSAANDPLIEEGVTVAPGQVMVTQALADDLAVQRGDTVQLMIGRSLDGQSQVASAEMEIVLVVPSERFSRPAMFVDLSDLLAAERFRDDAATTPENWRAQKSAPETYASFRLYVRDLEALDGLQAELEEEGINTRPRAENATLLLNFRKNLNILYLAVALLAICGFWAAMAANLRGMVERQRVAFSLLDLLGMQGNARRMIPIWQSVILVLSGICVTLVIVFPIVLAINVFFQTADGTFIASLGVVDVAGTVLLGVVTALTASIWAATAVRDIAPDEVLRHA